MQLDIFNNIKKTCSKKLLIKYLYKYQVFYFILNKNFK